MNEKSSLTDFDLYRQAINTIQALCLDVKLEYSVTLCFVINIDYAKKVYDFAVKNDLSCHANYVQTTKVATFRLMHSFCGFDYCSQCNTGIIAKFNIQN